VHPDKILATPMNAIASESRRSSKTICCGGMAGLPSCTYCWPRWLRALPWQ